MKITEVKTFLMGVGQTPRNWLFVKVYTDEGITGIGEASGWPKVIKAAIDDISPMVIGEDPMHIEKIWQLLYVGMMGHGMTGVVGSGAINGIEMALWDIKGKALNAPVCALLGGPRTTSVPVYSHFGGRDEGALSGPVGGRHAVRSTSASRGSRPRWPARYAGAASRTPSRGSPTSARRSSGARSTCSRTRATTRAVSARSRGWSSEGASPRTAACARPPRACAKRGGSRSSSRRSRHAPTTPP